MNYFIDPTEVVRLPILQGSEWIEIRKELSIAQAKHLESCAITHVDRRAADAEPMTQPRFGVDMGRYSIERAKVWLVRWSLTDAQGRGVDVTASAIEALRRPIFEAIEQAITDYLTGRDPNAPTATPPTTTASAETPSAAS